MPGFRDYCRRPDVVVWYNPRCSKCRGAAEILAAHGVSARRVFYLDEPPPAAEITRQLVADCEQRIAELARLLPAARS